jgi:hypothetical protein
MRWDMEGAGTGAAGGALAGTMVMPGIGTAVGAGAGFLLGGMMGDSMSAQTDPYRFGKSQAEMRNAQGANAQTLGQWAYTGQGPSNAQNIIDKNRADNAARMVGAAKSMPGGDTVLANRQAQEGIAQGQQAATLQGAMVATQEQQQAMQAYQAQLNQARQADVEMASKRLDIDQANKQNRAGFLSGMMNMGGSGGGLLGGLI